MGTNIVNNNKISCTLKSNFADTANYEVDYIDYISDDGVLAVLIAEKVKNTGNFNFVTNRVPIAVSQKKKYLSVKIEVAENIVLHGSTSDRCVKLAEVWNLLPFNVNRWSTDQTSYGIWDTINCMQLELNESYILGNPYIKDISTNGIENY